MPPQRAGRPFASLCLVATIALGLLSRRWPLPGWFAEHAGDALYATTVFWALAVASPTLRVHTRALLAFAIAAAVECSQLAHTPWLDELRQTTLGALVLGQGFQWDDFAAYALGALLAALLDRVLAHRFGGRRSAQSRLT